MLWQLASHLIKTEEKKFWWVRNGNGKTESHIKVQKKKDKGIIFLIAGRPFCHKIRNRNHRFEYISIQTPVPPKPI